MIVNKLLFKRFQPSDLRVNAGTGVIQPLSRTNCHRHLSQSLASPCIARHVAPRYQQLRLSINAFDASADDAGLNRSDNNDDEASSPPNAEHAAALHRDSGEAAVEAREAGDEGAPLTLGSAVLERMAKLRALDEYRELMAEATKAAADGVRQGALRGSGPSGRQSEAAAGAAAAAAGDDSALLLRGALLIARLRYPSLDEQKVYGMLDEMARRASALLPADAEQRYPLRVVAAINRVMYHDFGFRGNEEDYYNADNSCINRVMERRVGIPITLSLVYSEVARRLGLPMRGLNLPGHFMLQPVRAALPKGAKGSTARGPGTTAADGEAAKAVGADKGSEAAAAKEEEEEEDVAGPLEVMVDAFKSGEVCLPAEAAERISQLVGTPVRLDPQALRESRPLSPRLFLLRLLGNLRSIYLTVQQVDSLLDVLKFMRATLTAGGSEAANAAEGTSPGAAVAPGRGRGAGPGRGPREGGDSSGGDLFSDPAAYAAACASLARDEGLCYFALRRYPECLEALSEYVRLAEYGPAPMPAEEALTVSVVMEEARRRMTQQTQ